MTKRAMLAKKPRQKAAPVRKQRAALARTAKTAPLRSGKDDVKREAVTRKLARPAKRAVEAKRTVEKDSASRSFNPFVAMINSQVQLAGAMMRWSPLGLLLRSREAAPSSAKQA